MNLRPCASTEDLELEKLQSGLSAIEPLYKELQDKPENFNTVEGLDRLNVVAGKIVWLMTRFENLTNGSYDKESAELIYRFYNETVEFILTGERPMRIEVWEGILEDTLEGWVPNPDNLSAMNSLKVNNDSIKTKELRNDLLLYAHYGIISKWISQPDGAKDMFRSIRLISYFIARTVY